MPVPTLVTDLSTTLASNSPAGSDNVFPSLDEYLRAMSGFIASIRDNSGNGWVSPYATAANPNYTGTLTGGTGIVNLGSGQFYKSATGDVGIGTSSPTYKLDVVSGSGTIAKFTRGSIAVSAFIGASEAFWGTDTNHPLVFTTNSTERARITSGGDFGIGVTPTYKFDVSSTTGSAARFASTQATVILRFADGTAETGYIGSGTALLSGLARTDYGITASASGALVLGSNNTERMRIDAAGRLGIGTASPAAKLQVVGGQVLLDNAQYYGIKDSVGLANSVLTLDTTNNLILGGGGSTVTTQFWTGGAERARIDSSGNLLLKATAAGTSAAGVLGMGNATAPTTSPAGMGQLYVEGGALKFRGSSGTVTTIAPA